MPLHQRATVEGCGGDFPVGNVAKKDVELLLGNAGTWDCYAPIDCCSCRCWWKWLVKLSGSISSQYLTALLMAAPLALGDVEIEIIDKLISVVKSTRKAYVEGDASSASYFLAGAAVTGGTVTVEGCGTSSLQGDVRFAEVLEKMGTKVTWTENSVTVTGPPRDPSGKKHLHPVDVNMNKMPDVAMTVAVVAIFADGPTTIRDVASWRVKETERVIAICTELRKLGATVEEGPDYCVITPQLTLMMITEWPWHSL
ncbi:hypothetical protein MKW98_005889 [Papaver atlanticum]|uniref:3-phosphoshikimate 1-carboxyvinyltransferase n=1 Tax=Papaver atlanticum TaxID=357466 RepID=A0AAD4TB56_9MAGN|nr:hypothetical protein MKW98_005889 [Papaver atlanticum]